MVILSQPGWIPRHQLRRLDVVASEEVCVPAHGFGVGVCIWAWSALVVVVRYLVQLVFRQEVVVEYCLGEVGVW